MEKSEPTAFERKKDHIDLAFQSQVLHKDVDQRFYYEPLLSGHPLPFSKIKTSILGFEFDFPVWVSSMTGGTELAGTINKNLALACEKYNLGMGLGSCRQLLYSLDNLADFDVRHFIGDRPLFANLGIAQIEDLVENGQAWKVIELVDRLSADGLIIHINPLQEWLQPEGDRYFGHPIETVKKLIEKVDFKIIVKEVGQGMGMHSLKALMSLPIQAIDFAAHGGTNFSMLEILRRDGSDTESLLPIVRLGHTAEDMVEMTNALWEKYNSDIQCREFIISGGVKNYLDGYYLTSLLKPVSIYGQASGFLKYARESFEILDQYVAGQIKGLLLAKSFLKVRRPIVSKIKMIEK